MKTDLPTPQDGGKQEHDEFSEDGSPQCVKCGTFVNLRDNTEHTGYCDSCAQEIAVSSVNSIAGMRERVANLEKALLTLTLAIENHEELEPADFDEAHNFRATFRAVLESIKQARAALTPPQENKA
jgi:hypothetical protein